MTLIDRRVLVNAPPEIVWELLGDLTALPKWHVNCTQSRILSTHQRGVGVRWRSTMRRGPDVINDVMSWYENLGYEYIIVDGPYRSGRGRIRLQAIPEGTVVQWTLEYQPKGPLAGLRNALLIRRRVDSEIASSLKQLKRLVESTGIRMDAAAREKVAMRPAPSVSERAALAASATTKTHAVQRPAQAAGQTIAKMPPIPPETAKPTAERAASAPIIEEPPLNEDDTRPNPAIAAPVPPASTRPVVLPEQMAARADEAAARESEAPPGLEPETISEQPATADKEEAITEDFLSASLEPAVEVESPPDILDFFEAALEPGFEEAAPPAPETADQPADESPAEAGDQVPPTPLPPVIAEKASTADSPESAPSAEETAILSNMAETPEASGPSIWDVFGITPPSADAIVEQPPHEEAPAIAHEITTTAPHPRAVTRRYRARNHLRVRATAAPKRRKRRMKRFVRIRR